ncbi:hypothetical protein SAMN04489730_0177 [Amycolatopsis australiensis]|uniref:Uncharacterized protein n=1 Tax=Amycolatopsis australiensis TaxID=546364 RepID=A0A1K1LRU0_9PSEU|nr:hypothetical protein SAMN04489730_0177 [Amycolatopsis australiensis]
MPSDFSLLANPDFPAAAGCVAPASVAAGFQISSVPSGVGVPRSSENPDHNDQSSCRQVWS